MQALLYAFPASGNAGADNDSPYTVLTSGLACGQRAVRNSTPPPWEHTEPIQYPSFRLYWASCPPIPRPHQPWGNDRSWESERQCPSSSCSAALLAGRSWIVLEAAQLSVYLLGDSHGCKLSSPCLSKGHTQPIFLLQRS